MILVNGAATDSIAVTDRGLAYGDGIFRTLLSKRGVPRWWSRHYRKLERDCVSLDLPCPPEALLAEEIARVADRSTDEVVKIIVTRGSGARGYAPPRPASPTRVVMSAAVPAYPEEFSRDGVRVHWCRTRVTSQPRLAGVKHLNRLDNVLARTEWNDPATPEGLMLDADDRVVGGTMTNLFIAENDRLITPPLSACGVAGVTRERIIEAAQRRGLDCREEPITQARLLDAQEVLLVNSVIGAWPVRECAGRGWKPGPHAGRVREWLDEERD
jgi:4-amino-4-deoxychorismate lyase